MSWRDEAAAEAKEKKAGAGYTMDVGDNAFRIAPNKKGLQYKPFASFRIHRDVGPEKVWVVCGCNVRGEGSCWLCHKKMLELEASSSEQMRAMVKRMQPRDVLLLQVFPIDRQTKKFMAPKPWWAPYSGGRSLGVHIVSRLGDKDRSAIDDPKTGRNITVERTGSGLKTRYGPMQTDEQASVVPANLLTMLKSLEELTPQYNPKRQLAAWKGEKFEGDDVPPTAVEEEHGTDADYQLDETTEFVEELPADGEVLDAGLEEELGEYTETELEPETTEVLADDELGEFGEGFEDTSPELEPEPEPAPPAPRRQAPPAQPARQAPPAARQAARAAAPAPAPPRRTAAPPPARPAARAAAPPARPAARPAVQPPSRSGKPAGRR